MTDPRPEQSSDPWVVREGALSGVRVLDLTRILSGPFASMILADLGADVIKIEDVATGDDTRHWGPPFHGADAAYYHSVNRNKRSLAVDLKAEDGLALVQRLAGLRRRRPGELPARHRRTARARVCRVERREPAAGLRVGERSRAHRPAQPERGVRRDRPGDERGHERDRGAGRRAGAVRRGRRRPQRRPVGDDRGARGAAVTGADRAGPARRRRPRRRARVAAHLRRPELVRLRGDTSALRFGAPEHRSLPRVPDE